MNKRIVLVSGVTGQQGGSVVQALLKDGHHVIGFTRNPDSPKAKSLIAQGVEMQKGDFNDAGRILEAIQRVDAVFAMTTPFEQGIEAEIRQGIEFANLAKEGGVGHFVFNSVGNADKNTHIPHFDSKYLIEEHLKNLDMPYTIIAPVYFMDNLFFPWTLDALKQGKLTAAMPGDRKLQQIAVEDIGKFVAYVINKREEMFGQRVNIAGDDLSGNECAQILSDITGKEIVYEGFSPDYLKADNEDFAAMYEWFDKVGYSVDLGDFLQYDFLTFRDWAQKQDWSVLG